MLKLVALVALFAGFCWFGTQVQLGSHTLFGHLHAIAGTRESQDLLDGTRASARPLVDDVRRRIAGVPAPAKEPSAPVEDSGDAPEHTKIEAAKGEDTKDQGTRDQGTRDQGTRDQGTRDQGTRDNVAKDESAKDELARAGHHQPKGGPAQETLTPSERRHLRRLISSAEGASARQ